MGTPLRVLLIEDSEDDALLVLRELRCGGYEPAWERVDTAAGLAAALGRQKWDIMLCDYVMPQFSGPAALRQVHEGDSDAPVIIVSGEISQDAAIAAMKAGARDFVMKDNLARLVPAVVRELREAEGRREQRRTEEALRQTEVRLHELVDDIHAIVWEADPYTFQFSFVSRRAETLLGYPVEQWLSQPDFWAEHIHPDDREQAVAFCREATKAGRDHDFEYRFLTADGRTLWLRDIVHVVRDDTGRLARLRGIFIDITARKQTEVALGAAEQRFTTVFRESLDVQLVIDAETGSIVDVNERVRHSLGHAPEALIGQHFSVLQAPDGERAAADTVERTRVEGPVFLQTEFRRADGSLCPMDLTVTLVPWGERPALIATLRDVTERRQAEEAVRRRLGIESLVSAISSRFVGLKSEEVGAGITAALREVGEFLGASVGYVFLFEDGAAPYGWQAPGAAAAIDRCAVRASRSAWWMAQLQRGQTVLVARVAELPAEADAERALLESCGVESAVAIPMPRGESLRGFLGLSTSRVHRLRGGEGIVTLLRIVGEIFANALQRRRAEAALRESEQRHRDLVENLSEVIYAVDTKGRVTYVSPNVEAFGGYRPEEIVGRPFPDFIYPDDLPSLLESYQRTIAGHFEPSEYRVLVKSGEPVWVRTSSRPVYRGGELVGLQAVLVDITDRKRAEERQQLFALLVAQAPVGIVMTDASGQVTSANPAALHILGSPSEEATKQLNVLTLPNLLEAGISEVFRHAIAEKSAGHIEAPYRSYWGMESVVSLQVVPLVGHQGEVRGTLSIIEDTSERANWEQALRASEQRLRSVLDGLGPTVFVGLLSPDGRIIEANQPWLTAAGIQLDDIRGQILDQIPGLSHPDAVAVRVRAGIEQAARGTSWRGDIEVRPRRGGVMTVDLFLGPLRNEAGEVAYLVGSAVDVTDRTRAEVELRQLNAELERRVAERTAQFEASNKELEAFTYSVSHDLRAPLRAVDGFCRVLAEECAAQLDEQGRLYLERVITAAGRMGQLIDDLLALARVAHRDLALTDVDLGRLARSIAAELRRAQPDREVTFAIAEHALVRGDARLLRVALENLLGNAWKYTSKHPRAHIEFGVHEENGRPVYAVRDDGAGFEMRYAGRLFNAFQRLHGGEFEGTGIGLATVARIIHRHGGRIWAEGAVERGATFYFTLPAA